MIETLSKLFKSPSFYYWLFSFSLTFAGYLDYELSGGLFIFAMCSLGYFFLMHLPDILNYIKENE
jgi:hypothetical protein